MIWWIIATICAFFVKGLCGFANTLVFTTILSFGNNNINISPVELILGYPSNAILACKERRSIKWGICIPLAILVIVGSVPGVLFLKNSSTTIIKIIFVFVISCIGIEMVLREMFESLLGLKRDGTVVAAGNLRSGQEKVAEWTDIVAISAGQDIHVGLKSDGTIVIAGDFEGGFEGKLEFPDMTSMKDLYVPDVSVDNID